MRGRLVGGLLASSGLGRRATKALAVLGLTFSFAVVAVLVPANVPQHLLEISAHRRRSMQSGAGPQCHTAHQSAMRLISPEP
jgi:hypothetical protein